MESVIWKYPLQKGLNRIEIPADKMANVLSACDVGGQLCVYVQLTDVISSLWRSGSSSIVEIFVAYTGEKIDLPRDSVFLGTVVIGNLVYHVYGLGCAD